ncbi:MAG: hypothetical protein AAGA23_18250 [Pseudomonadota bacterium]
MRYAITEASRRVEHLLSQPDVKAELADQPGWESELTRIMLLRRKAHWNPSKPEAGQQANRLLQRLVDRQPEHLTPRALRYQTCGDAQPHEAAFAEQSLCREREARALVEHHPNNAFGHVLLAEGAWAEDNLPAAAEHLHRAGEGGVLDDGVRPGIQAVFATLDPLLNNHWDDAWTHRELGIYSVAGGLLDHRHQYPHAVAMIAQRCQTTTRDFMLSPCLALARALRLPGASVESVKLSLAVAGAVHQQRGEEAKARRVGQLRVAAQQAFAADSVQPLLLETIDPVAATQALLTQGEAHARLGDEPALIDLIQNAAQDDLAEPLAPCAPQPADASAINCLKRSTWWSEALVLQDFFIAQAQAPETLTSWARNPDPSLQVLYALHLRMRSGEINDPASLVVLEQVVESHPNAWFPRRVLMDRCISAERWDCVEKAALADAAADPSNGFASLQLAGLALKTGDVGKAREWIRLAGEATRYDRGFGGVVSGYYEAYQDTLTGPAVDPLNLRNATILSMSLGIAAALSGVDTDINKACREASALGFESCLEAARIMQLPGGDFLTTMVAQALEERTYTALGDKAGLAQTLEKKAALRELMGALDLDYVLQTENTADYVETLRSQGQIGAYRRYNRHRPDG